MFPLSGSDAPLESVAHIIQVALTPVFLLSGLAGLLSVFSTRLGRVADKVDHLSDAIETAEGDDAIRLSEQLDYLGKRSLVLDAAVVLGALGGGATCAAVLALFVGFLWQILVARILFAFFGFAIIFTLAALIAFVIEML
ncbi:MAG: DUF2721 domain-containing protein, partial [Roseiarcus sp.]